MAEKRNSLIKISIVILNWNGQKLLEQFLPNVLEHSYYPGAEVVVADNGSSDNSVKWMQENHPDVRVVALDKNYGFADGYNKALEQIKAEYYLLLNSDVEVSEGWLKPLVEFMDENPKTAACGPKILDYKNKKQFEYAGGAGGYIDRFAYPFCRGRIFTTVEEDKGQYNDVRDVMWVSGCAMVVRASTFRELDGLDGKFFAHQEEIDLCWRMKNFGYRVVCIPSSTIYHVGGASLNVGSPRKAYLNFRNSLLLLYKNLPGNQHRKSYRVRLVLDMVAAFKFLITDSPRHFFAVVRAHRDFHRMRKGYKALRNEHLKHMVKWKHDELLTTSIVKDYYLGGTKLFSDLKL